MAPVISKVAKRRPSQSQDLLLFATDKVRPALDELLAILAVFGESLEEFRHTLLQVIVMLYNAFVFCYMPAVGLALNSPTSLIFHAFIFLVLSSMFKAASTDPGSVPDTEKWRSFGAPPEEATERKKSTGEARWCQNSHAYKPDRAHYCRGSQRIVLRMDHYCPWVGNTIGFANHKYFWLFLLYSLVACSILGVNVLQLLVHATLPVLSRVLLIGAEGLTLLLSSILGPFFIFHCYLIARNMTTIEFLSEGGGGGGSGEADQSTYDVGIFRNLCSVLGENPLLWWAPWGGPPGDGLSFAKRPVGSEDIEDDEASKHAEALDPQVEGSCQCPIFCGSAEPAANPKMEVSPSAEAGGVLEAAAVSEIAGAAATGSSSSAASTDLQQTNAAGSEAKSPADALISTVTNLSAWGFAAEVTDDFKVGCQTVGQTLTEGAQALGDIAQGTLGDAVSRFSSMCTLGKKSSSKSRTAEANGEHTKRKSKSSRKSKKPLLSDAGNSDVGTDASEKNLPPSESDQVSTALESTATWSSGPASGSDCGS